MPTICENCLPTRPLSQTWDDLHLEQQRQEFEIYHLTPYIKSEGIVSYFERILTPQSDAPNLAVVEDEKDEVVVAAHQQEDTVEKKAKKLDKAVMTVVVGIQLTWKLL